MLSRSVRIMARNRYVLITPQCRIWTRKHGDAFEINTNTPEEQKVEIVPNEAAEQELFIKAVIRILGIRAGMLEE